MLLVLTFLLAPLMADAAGLSDAEYAKLRKEARERKRQVILNNDGCDVLYFPRHWEISKENFLKMRTSFLAGKCDTLMYCPISGGQGNFTLPIEGGDLLLADPPTPVCRNIAGVLLERKEDYFQWLIDFCKENNMELFFCFRFNDTHDVNHRPDKPNVFFCKFKDQNRHLLFGKDHNHNPRFGWWSAMDYSKKEVRDRQLALTKAVLDKYDVDGIDLDFSRYLKIFPSVANGYPASQAELDMMTDLMRKTRKILDDKGKERGKAILLSVVLPDSVHLCKNLGYDVEKWFAEGLIDIWQQHDGGQLSEISKNADFAHKYNVRYYAFSGKPYPWTGLSKGSLLSRNTLAGYKGRINNAIEGGADGLYLYNVSNSGDFNVTTGKVDPKASYFPTGFAWEIFRGYAMSPEDFHDYAHLSDHVKCTIVPGIEKTFNVEINKLPAAGTPVMCYVDRVDGMAENIDISINGTRLVPSVSRGRYESFIVPAEILKKGYNQVTLTGKEAKGEDLMLFKAESLGNFETRFYSANNSKTLSSPAPGVFRITGAAAPVGLVKRFANEEFGKLVFRFSAKVEKGTAFVRVSNYGYAWCMELGNGEIRFNGTDLHVAVDTAVNHDYEIAVSRSNMVLKVDGREVLTSDKAVSAYSEIANDIIPVNSRLYGGSSRAIYGVKAKTGGVAEFSNITISNPPGSAQIANLMIECASPEILPALPENLRRNAPGKIGKRNLDGSALPFRMTDGKEFMAAEITIVPGDRRSIWVVSNGKYVVAWTITRDAVAHWQVSGPMITLNNGEADTYVTRFDGDKAEIYRNSRLLYRTGESYEFTYDRGAHICTPEIVDTATFLEKNKRWFTEKERETIIKGGSFVRGLRENTEMLEGELQRLSLFEK